MVTVEFDEETAEVLFSAVCAAITLYWAWLEYSTLVEAAEESRKAHNQAFANERKLDRIIDELVIEDEVDDADE